MWIEAWEGVDEAELVRRMGVSWGGRGWGRERGKGGKMVEG